jgi:hypothetical protein
VYFAGLFQRHHLGNSVMEMWVSIQALGKLFVGDSFLPIVSPMFPDQSVRCRLQQEALSRCQH